jgi:hypothetical protein
MEWVCIDGYGCTLMDLQTDTMGVDGLGLWIIYLEVLSSPPESPGDLSLLSSTGDLSLLSSLSFLTGVRERFLSS